MKTGKKLVRSEDDIRKSMILLSKNDVLGIVTKRLGQNRVRGGIDGLGREF